MMLPRLRGASNARNSELSMGFPYRGTIEFSSLHPKSSEAPTIIPHLHEGHCFVHCMCPKMMQMHALVTFSLHKLTDVNTECIFTTAPSMFFLRFASAPEYQFCDGSTGPRKLYRPKNALRAIHP